MICNSGKRDRAFRIVLGLVIIAIGFNYGSYWGLIGLIPLLTGIVGFCGLYSVLGINNCKVKK